MPLVRCRWKSPLGLQEVCSIFLRRTRRGFVLLQFHFVFQTLAICLKQNPTTIMQPPTPPTLPNLSMALLKRMAMLIVSSLVPPRGRFSRWSVMPAGYDRDSMRLWGFIMPTDVVWRATTILVGLIRICVLRFPKMDSMSFVLPITSVADRPTLSTVSNCNRFSRHWPFQFHELIVTRRLDKQFLYRAAIVMPSS